MGYRSEIYIKATKVHKEPLNALMKEVKLDDSFRFKEDDKYIYYYGGWLKWYDRYEEVSAVNGYVKQYYDGTISLIQIGEDNQTEQLGMIDDFYPVIEVEEFCPIDDMKLLKGTHD